MTVAPEFDMRDVLKVLERLRGVQADLRTETNRELRAAAGRTAQGAADRVRAAGMAAATPQAALVARTVRVRNDRLPAIQIGGRTRVGRNGAPAAALLWGSERGGRNFPPGPGGPYWIEPAVRSYEQGPALAEYRQAVTQILSRRGLL